MNEFIKEYFNEVSTLTAVCRSNSSWIKGEYPELEIGKTYHVTHIGVQKSISYIVLSEFGPEKYYSSGCFEIFENGVSIDRLYVSDLRFLAPYYRRYYEREHPSYIAHHTEQEEIPSHLSYIEKKYNVKILLAVESGSCAWGFESKDSDWDVRFIYVHKPEWYFKVEQRDTIEYVYNNRLDMVGWDLKKALSLLSRSNPSVFEWLHSPTIYRCEEYFSQRLAAVEDDYFNPIKLMYHYNHIYNKHNERYLQQEGYPMKLFLYYLRGILACRWIEQKMTFPPVPFMELVDATVDDEAIVGKIEELIQIQRGDKECDITIVDESLMAYARHWDEYYNEKIDSSRPEMDKISTEPLDALLFDMAILYSDISKGVENPLQYLIKRGLKEHESNKQVPPQKITMISSCVEYAIGMM